MDFRGLDLPGLPEEAVRFIADFPCGFRAKPPAKSCGACSPCEAKAIIRKRKFLARAPLLAIMEAR